MKSIEAITAALVKAGQTSLTNQNAGKDASDEAFYNLETTLDFLVKNDPNQTITQVFIFIRNLSVID